MKKTLRIAGALALCFTMIPVVSSCGDDEDGNEPGGGNSVVVEGTGTRLVSLGGMRIKYDEDGRVYRLGSNDEFMEIDYKKGVIKYSDSEDYEEADIKVKFNSKGYISSLSQEWDYEDEDEWSKGKGSASFSYDGDGHLVKVTMSSSEEYKDYEYNEYGKYNEELEIENTWSEGNLVKVVENGKELGDDDGDDIWRQVCLFDYGMDQNKFLQMTVSQSDYMLGDTDFDILAWVGLFGVGSKDLPSRIDGDDEGYKFTDELRFTLNENGTIASEFDGDDTYIYGYDDVRSARSVSSAKLLSSKKGVFFRTHRDRR